MHVGGAERVDQREREVEAKGSRGRGERTAGRGERMAGRGGEVTWKAGEGVVG